MEGLIYQACVLAIILASIFGIFACILEIREKKRLYEILIKAAALVIGVAGVLASLIS